MPTPWLKFGEYALCLEQLPGLLDRGNLLEPLIRRVVIESAIRAIDVSAEEQKVFQKQFLDSQGIASPEQLKDWLESKGLTEEQASQNVVDTLRVEKLKHRMFDSKVEQTYLETKDLRDRVVYSLLRVKDPAAAQELYLKLEEGDATFTELSEEHSVGRERETGGMIGPVVLGRLHPKSAEVLRIANVDQLWPPMQVDDWWAVIRLDKKIPCEFSASTKKTILSELFESWLKQQVDQFIQVYRSSHVEE